MLAACKTLANRHFALFPFAFSLGSDSVFLVGSEIGFGLTVMKTAVARTPKLKARKEGTERRCITREPIMAIAMTGKSGLKDFIIKNYNIY